MQQISILGCGWLGFSLGKSLLENQFQVKGSTTSLEKMALLEKSGIMPFQILLNENVIDGDISSFLEHSEILILDIPPKLRGLAKENFVAKIKTLVPFIEKSSVKKVLFVSSTSVYSDANETITEATTPQPDTESGKQLLATERLLLANKNFQTTVLRFGGLIGDDRHPIRFLAGRKNIENPEAPINLIHQNDCIGIIKKIIAANCWNETFNAVYPFHPTRKAYYTDKAIEQNLPLPEFDFSKPSIGKLILSDKVEGILEYQFKNKI